MSEQEKIIVPSIEQPIDTAVEQPRPIEQLDVSKIESYVHPKSVTPPVSVSSTVPSATVMNERTAQIEKILEEDLSSVYFNLPEEKREAFRKQGEATAHEIGSLLEQTKVKVKKIVSLIRAWLLTIPGVNRFFLEQEAKLKADKILKLNEF